MANRFVTLLSVITNSVLNRPDFPEGRHAKHGLFKSELVIVFVVSLTSIPIVICELWPPWWVCEDHLPQAYKPCLTGAIPFQTYEIV